MTSRSNEQRQDITSTNQRRTKKELASALKSALSDHLEMVIWGLLKTPVQYEASEVKASSMKGLGTDEDSLIEIICSRNNQELQEINSLQEIYKTNLEDTVFDTSGDFCKLTVVLAKGRR